MAAENESIDVNQMAEKLEQLEREPADGAADPGDAQAVGDDAPEPKAEATDDAEPGERNDTDDAGEPVEAADTDAEPQAEETEAAAPPEFWTADEKAAWAELTPKAREVVLRKEAERVAAVNEKMREAATARTTAAEEVKKAASTIDEAAKWWSQAGPALQQAFADKWQQVNWSELAEKNPAEWARLNQMRMDEGALLQEANRRGQADIEAANKRAAEAYQEARRSEHAKVAAKLPEYFGTPEKATKTYEELSKFLFAKGIPADRISAIHEAPIIEIALQAMRFEQAQKKASSVTLSGTAKNPATQAPTRVAPGAPQRGANRASDAARQAEQRFKANNTDLDAAAAYLRATGL